MKRLLVYTTALGIAALTFSCYSGPQAEEAIQEPVQNKVQIQEPVKEEVQPVVEEKVEEPVQEISLSRRYSVEGKNAAGREYNGTVNVLKTGKGYNLTMKLRTRVIRGTGTLEGNRLTVLWGKGRRFEYDVRDDGTIRSTWERGEEVFTPQR
ncbi:MAG: hypothetical protein JXA20_00295 [Spirochaetes bacterium]|nr:hypothetical protein [Spirochaetota bacterium]